MIKFLLWVLLFVLCWPIALIALVLWPVVWLLSIPFRLLGIAVHGVFELLRAIVFCRREYLADGPDHAGDRGGARSGFSTSAGYFATAGFDASMI